MSKHGHHEGEGALNLDNTRHPDVTFEDRDLGGRGIVFFLIALGITCILLCLIVWGLMRFLQHVQTAGAQANPAQGYAGPVTPAKGDPTVRFPKPTLQPDDVADMNKLRSDNEMQLNSYGYVDQKAGIVHIPIEQAIDTLAKQGLPTRPQQQPTGSAQFGNGRATIPGEAGGTGPESKQ